MRNQRKVSKIEEINSLKKTIKLNEDALDYIQNLIYRTDNLFKLDKTDKKVEEELNRSEERRVGKECGS